MLSNTKIPFYYRAILSYLGIVLLSLLSCQNNAKRQVSKLSSTTENIKDTSVVKKPEEFFTDSLNIGRKSLNKVELIKYRHTSGSYVTIKFYSKSNHKWVSKNDFHFFENNDVYNLDTKLSDFNNDGLNDLTYVSMLAGNGANEVRRLFIYDKVNDKLIYMKNSEDYPNILYNKELNCIDAFLVYGGCSTVFLKISADSLKEFASVDLFDGLTVTTYNDNGKAKIIQYDKKMPTGEIRYKNYNPLVEYDDN
jgi:hypothetical protein